MVIKEIGIIGYGVTGQHLENFLNEQYNAQLKVIYFDDNLVERKINNAFPLSEFSHSDFSHLEFYLGLGYKHAGFKKDIIEILKSNKLLFPCFVHASSVINSSAKIGKGAIIYPNCTVDWNVVIGEGTILHNSCTISHDSLVGDCVFLSPSVTLCGRVTLGEKTFVGSAAVFANDITVGQNVQIGVGSVVTKNIPDNLSVIGNPARPVSRLRI